jgi:hypothetical protein
MAGRSRREGDSAGDFDEDRCRILQSEREAMLVDGEDAGGAGTEHADFGAGLKSHFVEPVDELGATINFEHASGFACGEEVQRNDLRGKGHQHGGQGFPGTETESQYRKFYLATGPIPRSTASILRSQRRISGRGYRFCLQVAGRVKAMNLP